MIDDVKPNIFTIVLCDQGGGLPEWSRTLYYEEATDRVFVPSELGCLGPKEALVCLGFDGADHINAEGHIYPESEWLKKEAPERAALIENAERNARKVMEDEKAQEGGIRLYCPECKESPEPCENCKMPGFGYGPKKPYETPLFIPVGKMAPLSCPNCEAGPEPCGGCEEVKE